MSRVDPKGSQSRSGRSHNLVLTLRYCVLHPTDPPTVTLSIHPQTVQEGERVRFTCMATANPAIKGYRSVSHIDFQFLVQYFQVNNFSPPSIRFYFGATIAMASFIFGNYSAEVHFLMAESCFLCSKEHNG